MAIQNLHFQRADGGALTAALSRTVAAGFTGADKAAIQAHVDELAEQGIAPPPHIPMLFPVLPTLVTNSDEIAVVGTDTTPEIEVALFQVDGTAWITVASDQTDRVVEAQSITLSKNICPKVVGRTVWPLDEVLDHWNDLRLTSRCNGTVLQDGPLSLMARADEILAFVDQHDGPEREGRLVLSGTIPTDAVPPKGEAVIEIELNDPVRGRRIAHSYRLRVLSEYFE
jgi:hypothetical protein